MPGSGVYELPGNEQLDGFPKRGGNGMHELCRGLFAETTGQNNAVQRKVPPVDDACQQLLELLCSKGMITAQSARSLQSSWGAGGAGNTLGDLAGFLLEGGLTSYQVQAVRENRIDELVWGNYLLLAPIGRGGMGEVFQCGTGGWTGS